MVVLTAVLALAAVVAGTAVLISVNQLRSDVAGLRAERDRAKAARTAAQTKLQDDFRRADLPGKLQKVRDLTAEVQRVLIEWDKQQLTSGLKNIRAAADKCQEAVFDYDATAAQFPQSMLQGLPQRIDINDDSTNCGRF
jgi:hypothetical protein